MNFGMTVLVAIMLLSSQSHAADLALEYREPDSNFQLLFSNEGFRLSGNPFTLEIEAKPCSQTLLNDYRQKIEKMLSNAKTKKNVAREYATLNVQGVGSKISLREPLVAQMRKIPFEIFTLRQMSDRICKKSRAVASDKQPNVAEQISQLNQAKSKCEKCEISAIPQANTDVNECLVQLCPDPKISNKAITDLAVKVDAFQDPVFKSEILPILKLILASEKRTKEHRDSLLKKATSAPITNQIELDFLKFISVFSQIPFEAHDVDSKQNPTVDVEVLRKMRPNWTNEMIKEVQGVAAIMNLAAKENPIQPGSLDRLVKAYSPIVVLQHIQVAVNQLKAEWEKLTPAQKATMGYTGRRVETHLKQFSDMAPYLSSFESLPDDILDSLHGDFTFVNMYRFMPHTEDKSLVNIDRPKFFAKLNKDIQENLTSKLPIDTEPKLPMQETCAASFSILKALSPTAAELSALKSKEGEIKNKFLDSVAKMFSSESMNLIRTNAVAWRFAMPQNDREAIAAFKSTLVAAQVEALAYENLKPESLSVMDFMNQALASDRERSVLSSVCVKTKELVRDAAYSVGAIYISPIVAKNWPQFSDVVNHELGHLLNRAMKSPYMSEHSTGVKKNLDQCLYSNHGQVSGAKDKFAEEDSADFFAAYVDPEKSKAIECLFIRDWSDPTLFDEKQFSVKTVNNADTHSGMFLRALSMSAMSAGGVPKACLKALAAKGEKPQIKDCRPASVKTGQATK